MSRRLLLAAALLAAFGLAATASAGSGPTPISVTVDRKLISTKLGKKFVFRTTIVNRGSRPARGLIAHLNVLSLRDGTYVDPEDWSPQRTWYLGALQPGASRTIRWSVQAVNSGSFATYVAIVDQQAPTTAPVTGPAVELRVAGRRTINSDGILPLALGVPILIGLLTAGARLRRRRG